MGREFIAHSTKTLHFPVGLSTSASSHHDLSLAAFITNIVESDFSVHTPAFIGLTAIGTVFRGETPGDLIGPPVQPCVISCAADGRHR
jgi:hypothetical protein